MNIYTKTNGKGRGVYAKKSFLVNEIVVTGKPVTVASERTRLSLQMDVDHHVRMDEPFELVNHSCNPNCGIKPNQYDGYNLVAMKDISVDEEISFDYCMTEWYSISVQECLCGSKYCRKTIKGGKFLSPELIAKYDGFFAPFYQKM